MKPLTILLAALCGFAIASAIKPRHSLRLETKAPEPVSDTMPDNIFEVQSLIRSNELANKMLIEKQEQVRLWKARASYKAIALPRPEERKN